MMNTEPQSCPRCHAPIPPEAPQGLCPKCLLAAASIPTETGTEPVSHPSPTREAVAAAFPHLEIFECIGKGGMGFVFKARQPKLDRFVALKLLSQKADADPAFGERFHREAKVLARLSHPNIVGVHDFGQAGGFFYLLMEFVDGVNLRQAMHAGRFTSVQALSLVPKICDALQYAHEEGVLHRDIKPENLLLDTRGRLKIADFGIAKLLGEAKDITLTSKGAAVGTPHYMAPEQLERPHDVDQRADVYSLGVVFYEMLTGELPLGRFAPPSEKTPLDPRVDEVVLRALEKERERRFQSAGAVKDQVETITSTSAKPGGDTPHFQRQRLDTSPPSPRVPARWSFLAISAFVLVAFSLLETVPLLFIGAHVGPRDFPILVLLLSIPALVGTCLGWLALRTMRNQEKTLRGGKLALLAFVFWPLVLVNGALLISTFLVVMNFELHVLHARNPVFALILTALGLLGLIPVDAVYLHYTFKRWNSNRTWPGLPLAGWGHGLPRWLIWATALGVVFLMPLFLLVGLRKANQPESVLAPTIPLREPSPPIGFDVPSGRVPGSADEVYSSILTVPAGYALTLTGVLCSNRVVLDMARPPAAYLLAPPGRSVEARLNWRFLGNTTLAEGAPLELTFSLMGSDEGARSFHIIPPEPLTMDWVGIPARLWPPQTGHTKYLLACGTGTIPTDGNSLSSEWAVGIETRLYPIPSELSVNLKTPMIGLGTNWHPFRFPASAGNSSVLVPSEKPEAIDPRASP